MKIDNANTANTVSENHCAERGARPSAKLARWLLAVMLCSGVVGSLSACDSDDGPLEKAGKSVDQTSTNVGNAIEDKCEDAKAAAGANDTRC